MNEDRIIEMLGALQTDMNARFDIMDARLTTMDARLTAMDARFDTIEDRLTAMDVKIDHNFAALADSQAHITEVVGQAHADVNRRLDNNTEAIKQLAYNQLIGKAQ